jgi:hypothetical protein
VEEEVRLAKAVVGAYLRSSQDKMEVAKIFADKTASKSVKLALKPPRPASTLRKAGALLILTPDPFTAVPGVMMVAASFAMQRREAAGLEELIKETANTMRSLQSLI